MTAKMMRHDEAIIDQTNHWTTNRHLSDLRRLVVYAYNAMSLNYFCMPVRKRLSFPQFIDTI